MKVDNPTVQQIRESTTAIRVMHTLDERRFDSYFSLRGAIEQMSDDQIQAVINAMNQAHKEIVAKLKLVVTEQHWELT